jgi:UDP-glucose 4-epimerase
MDDYRGQKILVTGGLGFIGSNLAVRLVGLGASVVIVDSRDPAGGANDFNIAPIKNDVEVVEGDCCDLGLMRRLVRGTSHVFSLAGRISHTDSMEDPVSDMRANALASLTVLEACKLENRGARVVYTGTRQVYGRPLVLPLVETLLPRPTDVNGVNKLAGEQFHLVYHQAYGIATASLRLVNTFGPRQLVKHARHGFIGWFVRQALEGGESQLFGDGQQFRGFNYIDDAVDALLVAGSRPEVVGDYFNLGGMKPFTLEALVQMLIRAAGSGTYRIVPFPPEKTAIDIGSVYSSWMKFHFATGWQPQVPLEEGLQKTVAYYKEHRGHYW